MIYHTVEIATSSRVLGTPRNDTLHLSFRAKRGNLWRHTHVVLYLDILHFFMNQYYVYIMTNKSKTLYIGITSDLYRRVFEHKQKFVNGFTKKYNINKLVYYEITNDVNAAIAREKQIKIWRREKKIKLIEDFNLEWRDLNVEL